MTLRRWRYPLVLFAAIVAIPSAFSQVTFTITATASHTVAGYLSGNSYTFAFVTTGSFANNGHSSFISGAMTNNWVEHELSDEQLWSSFSGDGLTGSFVRPADENDSPYSYLYTKGGLAFNRALHLLAASEDNAIPIGLTAGSSPYTGILAAMTGGDLPDFTSTGSHQNIVDYFQSYTGTYTPGGSSWLYFYVDAEFYEADFSITGLTISVAPIPEPSTYATLAGTLALMIVVCRRRRTVTGR